LSVGAQVVLVNAATFDGHWAHEFDPRHTDDEPFRTAGGQDVQVKMMHLSGADLPCTNRDQESGIAAVELPYLGGQYAMLLILPPEDQNVYDFAKRLSPDALHRLLGKLTDEEVELGLPRFEMFDSHDIMDYLASKGLKNIDLGAISPQLTPSDALDQVVQKTWIETDEEGTRAAVASGSSDVGSSTTQMPIIFNRPFIFIVRHESTGAILFFGIVQNPLG
ncbi:MAG TPA: serpin family protein, partial [Fimbriimonadaceae bacterium]|nr:serpin family protein [Fimbriimonadaceae bacterium]